MRGFSDSNAFRAAFPDAIVYGFCPHRQIGLIEQAPLVHGADERVPVADIELAAGFFYELPRRMLSSAERTNVDGAGSQNGDRADAAEDEYVLRLGDGTGTAC